MKKVIYSLLIFCCFVLMGCPLSTSSPIMGDTDVSSPSWIAGQWQLKSSENYSQTYLVKLNTINPSQVKITTLKTTDGKTNEEGTRDGYFSKVNGQLFISIYDANGLYYHYAISGNIKEITLIPLKEGLVSDITNGKELAAFIAKSNPNDYLDNANTEFYQPK